MCPATWFHTSDLTERRMISFRHKGWGDRTPTCGLHCSSGLDITKKKAQWFTRQAKHQACRVRRTETSPQTACLDRLRPARPERVPCLFGPAVEGGALTEALAAFFEEVRTCRVSVNKHGLGCFQFSDSGLDAHSHLLVSCIGTCLESCLQDHGGGGAWGRQPDTLNHFQMWPGL